MQTSDLTPDELRARLHKLGLHGLLAQWDEIREQPWLRMLISTRQTSLDPFGVDRWFFTAR